MADEGTVEQLMQEMNESSVIKNVERIIKIEDAIVEQDAIDKGKANILYKQLVKRITDFEKNLKNNEEIGAYLAAFGKEILIHIENVGYQDPYFVIFQGKLSDESEAQLIQHVSQINVLLVATKIEEGKKPKRIGFLRGSEIS